MFSTLDLPHSHLCAMQQKWKYMTNGLRLLVSPTSWGMAERYRYYDSWMAGDDQDWTLPAFYVTDLGCSWAVGQFQEKGEKRKKGEWGGKRLKKILADPSTHIIHAFWTPIEEATSRRGDPQNSGRKKSKKGKKRKRRKKKLTKFIFVSSEKYKDVGSEKRCPLHGPQK